ncbi:DNA repair protein RecO [Clostridium bornimense]|uniref:DNA repair protein RecO n=1 Tax=Clostridium bornimense TaxID=1216932 RepID=UPI0025D58CEC|nr:DNA repair protein RecO [uncultured Clostridium sp.]
MKTRAIVLKSIDYKERDKIITVFSESLGKISIMVRGVKSSKSKMLPLTLPMSYSELVLFKGKGMYTLNEGFLIDSFQEMLKDIYTLTYGNYILELIDMSMVDDEVNTELFKSVIVSFYFLKNKAVSDKIVIRKFELDLLKYTGHSLNFENCGVCRRKIISSNYVIYPPFSGVCGNCNKKNGIDIAYSVFSFMKYLYHIDIMKLHILKENESIISEIEKINSELIVTSIGKRPKSLELLEIL